MNKCLKLFSDIYLYMYKVFWQFKTIHTSIKIFIVLMYFFFYFGRHKNKKSVWNARLLKQVFYIES